MKVCVLIDAWEPLWGGGPKNAWEISRRLVKRKKWNIDIFTRSIQEGGRIFGGIQIHSKRRLRIIRVGPTTSFFNIFGRIIWLGTVIVAVWCNHNKKPYDVIHAHAYSAGIPGKILSLLLHVPIIFTVHGSNNLDLHKKTPTAVLEHFILTKISYDRQISVSQSFLKHSNINTPVVIPNGVTMRFFNRIKNRPSQNKNFTLLFVGRFDAVKGVTFLLNAFFRFHTHHKNTKLLLVGYGYEERKVRRFIEQSQLEKSIILKGKQIGQSLIRIYKSVDIVVVPSLSEGQSIVILEALAAKKPVIATNVGDNRLFIQEGKTGFLVQPRNSNELYKVFEKAYQDSHLVSMGVRGYTIVQQYSWEKAAAATADIYESFI